MPRFTAVQVREQGEGTTEYRANFDDADGDVFRVTVSHDPSDDSDWGNDEDHGAIVTIEEAPDHDLDGHISSDEASVCIRQDAVLAIAEFVKYCQEQEDNNSE